MEDRNATESGAVYLGWVVRWSPREGLTYRVSSSIWLSQSKLARGSAQQRNAIRDRQFAFSVVPGNGVDSIPVQ